jgi:RNA polymerase sigma-70 factor (ECF subfamily)
MSFSDGGRHTRVTEVDAVAAATAGDEAAFGELAERFRHELQVHCYRLLGSFEDAEDLVQETFLRAWRKRGSFRGRSTFRAWLYGIATNACLDALERRPRRTHEAGVPPPEADLPWLQPFPDRLLDGIATSDAEPDAVVVAKETIELAFIVAIQQLPARQRAVLIVRDILGWSAQETASLLEASVASVNSALQRARATLKKHLPERRLEWAPGSDPSEAERALLERYMEAHERADATALAALLREDALQTMPPEPSWYAGREAVAGLAREFFVSDFGHMRCLLTRANRQPAVAIYLRKPDDAAHRPMALDVLRVEGGLVAEITTFVPELFPAFALPATL